MNFGKIIISFVLALLASLACGGEEFVADGVNYVVTDDNRVCAAGFTPEAREAQPEALVIPAIVVHDGTTYRVTRVGLEIIDDEKEDGEDKEEETPISFAMLPSLATVSLGCHVDTISASAFAGCEALRTVTIYGPATHIEEHAFAGCEAIEHLYCGAAAPHIDATLWDDLPATAIMHTLSGQHFASLPQELLPEQEEQQEDEPLPEQEDEQNNEENGEEGGEEGGGEEEQDPLPEQTQQVTIVGDWAPLVDDNGAAYRVTTPAVGRNQDGRIELIALDEACTTLVTPYSLDRNALPELGGNYVVNSIAPQAAMGHPALTSVDLRASVALTSTGEEAFSRCEALTSFATRAPFIAAGSLAACPALTTLTLASGVKELQDTCLAHSEALTTVNLPATVNRVATTSFDYMPSLTTFVVANGNTTFAALDDALVSRDATILWRYPAGKEVDVPHFAPSITTLAPHALHDQQHITHIEMPPSVTAIGDEALAQLPQLQWAQLPSTLAMGADLKGLLAGNTLLETLVVNKMNVPPLGEDNFDGVPDGCELIVPLGRVDNYVAHPVWGRFADHTHSGSYDFVVEGMAFTNYNPGLKTYNGVNYAGGAVRIVKCDNRHVLISAGDEATMTQSTVRLFHPEIDGRRYFLDEVGDSAFADNPHIEQVLDDAHTTWIHDYAFAHCPALTTVQLPHALQYHPHAFDGCALLASVDFDQQTLLHAIDECAFQGCASLTSIDLSNTQVATIGAHAFDGCTQMNELALPSGEWLRSIDEAALRGTQIEVADFPYGLMTIGPLALAQNNVLQHVRIPSSVTMLPADFVRDCPALQRLLVNLNNPPTSWCESEMADIWGTTLHDGLQLFVPVNRALMWSKQAPALADYVIDGGSYDIVHTTADDAYCLTVTAPATRTEAGAATIVQTHEPQRFFTQSDIVIPDTVVAEGQPYVVTTLGERSLMGYSDRLRTVRFGEALTRISDWAMTGSNVERVGQFDDEGGASRLTAITYLGKHALEQTALRDTIDISATLMQVGDSVFHNTPSLHTLIFRHWITSPSRMGTNVWNSVDNPDLKVLVDHRTWDYFVDATRNWKGQGGTALRPFYMPWREYAIVSLNVPLDFSPEVLTPHLTAYYVTAYDREHEWAITAPVDHAVAEATAVILRSDIVEPTAGKAGELLFELPMTDEGTPLSDNKLIAVPNSETQVITKHNLVDYYKLDANGNFVYQINTLALYASGYFTQMRNVTNKRETIPLDISIPRVYGDINGDGIVSSVDLAIIVNILAGLANAEDYDNLPDVNGDGSVTATDIAAIVNILAGL